MTTEDNDDVVMVYDKDYRLPEASEHSLRDKGGHFIGCVTLSCEHTRCRSMLADFFVPQFSWRLRSEAEADGAQYDLFAGKIKRASTTDELEEWLRSEVRARERERDEHRSVLNQIADLLHVVHEDPKIYEAVKKLVETTRIAEFNARAMARAADTHKAEEATWRARARQLFVFLEMLYDEEGNMEDLLHHLEGIPRILKDGPKP